MMPTTLTRAVRASLLLPVQAVKQPPTAPPHKLNAVLCKSEAQAIALAGRAEPIAVNSTLADLRFAKDDALARTASWVAPFQGAKLQRGT